MAASSDGERGIIGGIVRPFLTGHLSVLLLIAALAAGTFAVLVTPREEDPQIVVPMADVFVHFPGASAEEVEQRVARPLESLLWQIDGVEHVYSRSSREQAVVTVRFYVGEDRVRSLVKLHNRIRMHIDLVPPGIAGWVIKPLEIDDVPVVNVTLHGPPEHGPHELRRIGEELLANLEHLQNISRTDIVGGMERRVMVRPDSARLAGYDLSPLEVVKALRGADASLDAGAFVRDDRVHEVSSGPFLHTAADVEDVVVGVHQSRPIQLADVATVTDGPAEPESYTRVGFGPGSKRPEDDRYTRPSVTLAISKKKGTNAVEVAEQVLARVEEVRRTLLPEGVEVLVTRNSGHTADEKVNDLLSSLFFAIVSVVILVSLAMGWREGLVVAAAVPVSFSLALMVNYLVGFTINRVTLFALILSLGLVVDDPITNVDNIQRHLRMKRKGPLAATLDAVEEVLPPVLMSTLAIIVSFLPMFFITGMMGPYMGPMAINVPLAVTFSTLAALTFVPWLALILLRARYAGDAEDEDEDGTEEPREAAEDPTPAWARAASRWVLGPLLRTRARSFTMLAAVAILWAAAMSLPLFRLVPLKMLPFDNKNEFQLVIDMPEGTTLERTDAVVRRFEDFLDGVPEVTDYQSYVGVASPMDFNGMVRHYYLRRAPHLADVRVSLTDKTVRDQQSHTIALRLRDRLTALADELGARLKIVEVPPGPPVIATVVAEVYGPPGSEHEELLSAAEELMERMAEEPGMVDLDHTGEAHRTRWQYVLDKEKAALHGVTTGLVTRTLRLALGGQQVGILHQIGERNPLQVFVRLPEPERSSLEQLLDIEVKAPRGHLVALGELGRFEERPEDQSAMRKDLRPVVFVYAEMAGRAPGEAILDLQSRLAEEPLSQDVEIEWAGEGEWQITIRVFRDLGIAFGVALLGIYLLLVIQTSSFSVPMLVMLAIPLTGLGIMPGFWLLNMLTGATVGGYEDVIFFTATAMIGMIALGGIVVRNAIVLIEFIEDARGEGTTLREAVLDADAVRIRPIVLTAITTAIGAIPIAFDPIFSGLAYALIFGLAASTLFTLVVIPTVYYELNGGQEDRAELAREEAARAAEAEAEAEAEGEGEGR